MTAPSALLPCERCGRVSAESAAGRFTFCPGCELYVCGDCWIGSHGRCLACAMPEATEPPGPVRVMVRETIGAPPETTDARRRVRTFEVGALNRGSSPAPLRRPRRRSAWRTGGRRLLDFAIHVAAATVLAIFLTASIWAVELAMRGEVRAPALDATPLPKSTPMAAVPTAPATPEPGSAVPGEIYVVRAGDTLRGIARRMLGNEVRWTEIVDANGGRIDDPNNLRIGSELRLPTS